jgi:hypothetical protein
LNGVNPVMDLRLAADGTLTFANASVAARAATPGRGYTVSWSRFDNAIGKAAPVGDAMQVTTERAMAPVRGRERATTHELAPTAGRATMSSRSETVPTDRPPIADMP